VGAPALAEVLSHVMADGIYLCPREYSDPAHHGDRGVDLWKRWLMTKKDDVNTCLKVGNAGLDVLMLLIIGLCIAIAVWA
jgi:hypothetical protein